MEWEVQARDELRNKRLCGGDIFVVNLTGPDDIQVDGSVEDKDDGTHTVTYTATTAGRYQLHITNGAVQRIQQKTSSTVCRNRGSYLLPDAFMPACMRLVRDFIFTFTPPAC